MVGEIAGFQCGNRWHPAGKEEAKEALPDWPFVEESLRRIRMCRETALQAYNKRSEYAI